MDSSPAPNRRRVRRFLRIAVGWLLIALLVVVMVTAPTTKTPPRLHCGKPAIVLMFVKNAADVPASRLEACHHEAGSQVLGSLFIFGLPGAVLLLWKRLHWRLPSRAVRPPRRPSRFGPAPIEMALASRLERDTAAERLRTLGNGGPRGSLRVRFGPPDYVDARLVLQSSPRFFGTLTATPDGSQLRGATRPATDATWRIAFLASGAVVSAIVSLGVLLAGAPSGKINVGFLLLAGFAAFFGGMAYGLRRLMKRTFPLMVNSLSGALAAALDTTAPLVPTDPQSTRTATRIGLVFVALQFVAVGARVAVNGGFVAGFVAAAVFAAIALVAYRASLYWRPRLEGTELRAGLRHLDLTQVNDVRARAGLMSLSDGRTRIVLTSALGRPEGREGAQLAFTAPDASADLVEQVRLYQAVDDAISRCPLDERTATTLHRPVTMPGVSRSGPLFDPSALAPVLIMLGGLALALVLLAAWR